MACFVFSGLPAAFLLFPVSVLLLCRCFFVSFSLPSFCLYFFSLYVSVLVSSCAVSPVSLFLVSDTRVSCIPRPGCQICQDPGVIQCPSVSPCFLSAFRCFLSARMRIYYNVSLLPDFPSSLKNMFFNTFVNQRLIKMFKRNSKKIPLYIWLVCYKVLLLHPLSRTEAAMFWHSDRNGVGTLTYFFCLGLVSFWNSPLKKQTEKNFRKHLEDMK